jgi:hypothetical protein
MTGPHFVERAATEFAGGFGQAIQVRGELDPDVLGLWEGLAAGDGDGDVRFGQFLEGIRCSR